MKSINKLIKIQELIKLKIKIIIHNLDNCKGSRSSKYRLNLFKSIIYKLCNSNSFIFKKNF